MFLVSVLPEFSLKSIFYANEFKAIPQFLLFLTQCIFFCIGFTDSSGVAVCVLCRVRHMHPRCTYLVGPTPFVEDAFFHCVYSSGIFVKTQLSVGVWLSHSSVLLLKVCFSLLLSRIISMFKKISLKFLWFFPKGLWDRIIKKRNTCVLFK